MLAALLLTFGSMDEAAIAALTNARHFCSPRYECGGVIRYVDGVYEASGPVTSLKPYFVSLDEPYGDGVNVVADFHTHTCLEGNKPFHQFFSWTDAEVAQDLHMISYMLDLCTGLVHRYDPSQDDRDDEEVDFHSGKVIYLTIGHIVGWIPK